MGFFERLRRGGPSDAERVKAAITPVEQTWQTAPDARPETEEVISAESESEEGVEKALNNVVAFPERDNAVSEALPDDPFSAEPLPQEGVWSDQENPPRAAAAK